MGYILLWIETLAVSLLFVAWLTACVARWRRKWLRGLVWIAAAGLLLLAYLLPTIGIGFTNFYQPPPPIGIPHLPGFYPLAALTIGLICGIIILRRKGMRKIAQEEPAIAAACWPRAKLFGILCVAAALQCMTFWNLDLEACQKLSALQTEMGAMALTLEPAKIPDSDNAAPIYERAAEILNSPDTSPQDWDLWLSGLREDPPKLDVKDAKVAEFFRHEQGALDLLRQAAAKPGCAFERINKEYWSPSFEELKSQIQGMRQLSRFLASHAYWAASTGDTRSALQDLQSMYALAQHECGEPLLVVQLVGCAIEYNATDMLQKVLKLSQPTAEDLSLLKIDSGFSYQKPMQKVVRRESLIGWSFLSQFAGKKMINLQFTQQVGPFSDNPRFLQSVYRVFVLPSEITVLQDIYNDIFQVAAQPFYRVSHQWDELQKSAREKSVYPCSMMIPLLIPSIKATLQSAASADANRNTSVLAVAILRYQLKNGRFPEKLSELVPDCLFKVPLDPFDGKPMKYKRTDKGAVIYSLGPDSIDDGGKPMDDKQKGDISFELIERKP